MRSPLDLPVGLLLAVVAGVTVLGNHPLAPVRGLVTGVGVFVLTVGVLRRLPGARGALLFTALLATVVPTSMAVAQVAQGTQTGFSRIGLDRAIGTFTNPNTLAAYLLLLAPFAAVAGGLALALVRWAVGRRSRCAGPAASPRLGRHRRGNAAAPAMMPVFGLVGFLALAAMLAARDLTTSAIISARAQGSAARRNRVHSSRASVR